MDQPKKGNESKRTIPVPMRSVEQHIQNLTDVSEVEALLVNP